MIDELMPFDLPSSEPAIIKVIGVGGGGGNAVTNMYREGIRDVSYMICNTDRQAMLNSAIPDKLQLGPKTTKGLGAGNHPEIAKAAAEESIEDIKAAFGEHTRMVFVTAGMGGGTGTGAAPVIAGIARDMGILTVGIVTIPFRWEGESKINQALDGVEEMSKNVDALLVINNEQLFRIYPEITVKNAFLKADDTLTTAAKSIAEIITVPGYINLDFADVNTVLREGGVAVMSAGYGDGQQRLTEALNSALKSPLLNNNDVFRARKILFNITCSDKAEIMTHEMEQIRLFMDQFVNQVEEVIWGIAADNDLDDQIKVTMLASGFGIDDVPQVKVHRQIKTQELEEDIEEKRRKRENRKGTYYPDNFGIPPRRLIYKSRVLSNQELDDEEIIDQLDKQPANQRPFA
ncbi:MAG: cell division protein FtsZ [Bacteroidales bacterium]|jgi:cell division protein FtsZ|nr:cell division protein FtsZ [Bacteroidales bacterium]MDD2617806.1 cell division protein FtsZ [Bacteroidales bacterium]MDD4639986.1 cell division protein FtsZ [Bacteroidales bacterium]